MGPSRSQPLSPKAGTVSNKLSLFTRGVISLVPKLRHYCAIVASERSKVDYNGKGDDSVICKSRLAYGRLTWFLIDVNGGRKEGNVQYLR